MSEHRDYEDREVPFGGLLASEAGVDASGGYAVPGAPFAFAGARALLVNVTPPSTDTTVDVRWRVAGAAGSSEVLATQTALAGVGSTLLFDALGTTLQSVTFTGDASLDYALVEANNRPLPVSAAALPGEIWQPAEMRMDAGSNWFGAPTADVPFVFARRRTSNGTQGAQFGAQLHYMPPANWSIELLCYLSGNYGQYHVFLTDYLWTPLYEIAAFEGYTLLPGVVRSYQEAFFATTGDPVHGILVSMDTKNGASAGYIGSVAGYRLQGPLV